MRLPTQKHELTDVDYLRYAGLVRAKSGLEVPEVRRPDLEKAVLRALAESAISDPGTLFEHLANEEEGSSALETLIARITVGETHFFRNRPQFDALEKHILPDLIERRRSIKRLRIWSAGCSTGEEPYSLAILARRLIPDLAEWNVSILATDINREALEKAHKGEFGSWSFREVPPSFQANYFSRADGRYVIQPAIRDMVTFAYLNLVEDSYPSMLTNTQVMDLILCRNVLIYFNESANQMVVDRLHACLANEGWLVVGHAEPSQSIYRKFRVHNFPGAIVYQKAEPFGLPGEALPGWQPPAGQVRADLWIGNKPVAPPRPAPPARSPSMKPAPRITPIHRKPSLPPPAGIQVAVELFDTGRIDEAITGLAALATAEPQNAWPPFWLAKIYANRLDLENAERWIDVALELDPLLAVAHYVRGLILDELDRQEQSLEALRSCLYADPDFLLGHFSLAGVMARMGQPQRAMKALQNLEKLIAGKDRDEKVPEGDGMTIGRLAEFIAAQKELMG